MHKLPYELWMPAEVTTAVVFASPHSGRDYDPAFLRQTVLDPHEIRSSEDAFVDRLFAAAPDCGAPLIAATCPRAMIDLNRAPDEFDPALFDGLRRTPQSPRVASGLGVVPRVVANGRAIYQGKLPIALAHDRVARFWRPYHDAVQMLLDQSLRLFGRSILIDCHSMPHESLENIGAPGATRPDVVIGDRFGAAASAEIVEQVEAAFAAAGLNVARNMPFAGAYVTQAYGRPSRGQHAIQIEIDRRLYMNEATIVPNAGYEPLCKLLSGVIAEIARIGEPRELPIAAE